jgi:DUF1680 family protein
MKNLFLLLSIMSLFACNQQQQNQSSDYPFKPVEFTRVHFSDDFWKPRMDTNRLVTIPFDFKKCEETNRINNFAVAGGIVEGKFEGRRYNDSDLFKVMEGASYSLTIYPDRDLEMYLDSIISLIAAAQEDDGYLFTCRTINPDSVPKRAGEERWSYLKSSHELYNVGHMYEAAVAHYRATGKTSFLDIATKNADLICETFGPGEDQLHGVPGHQEIEMGLVKLYRVTGEKKYLDMAKYFLDQRGNPNRGELYTYGEDGGNDDYTQDHLPVTQQKEAVGHAVRAAYMYSGMADVAAMTGDQDYVDALSGLWENVVGKKLYITGGIGSRYAGEAFGDNYELPNLSAYCETCAAIANMLWNQRMFLLHGDAKYIDVLERTLYNNFLAGVSVHGDEFFYPNPLESDGSHRRSPWFDCACCPTNVVRFMPSLPGYVYATKGQDVFVNLYIGGEASVETESGTISLKQETEYPWNGKVKIVVDLKSPQEISLKLRIPGWARNEAIPGDLYFFDHQNDEQVKIAVNGLDEAFEVTDGYATLHKVWETGDEIEIEFPMPVRKIQANSNVEANTGRMCIQRGPLVFAAEGIDNGGEIRNVLLSPDATFDEKTEAGLADGVTVLTTTAQLLSEDKNGELQKKEHQLKLIPYYAWNHRGPNTMLVWFPFEEASASPTPPPTIASQSKVSASYIHDVLAAVNDQVLPNSSDDHSIPRFTFWDHKGTREWVMYEFNRQETVSTTKVFWFDDGPNGGCRVPESWELQYRDLKTGQWKYVDHHEACPVECHKFNTLNFVPVTTNAIRLEVNLQDGFSGGIMEWKVQ